MLIGCCVVLLVSGGAWAYVILDSPNGGQVYNAGQLITFEWHPDPVHPMGNWDLWYSTTGDAGPWIEVAMDLFEGQDEPAAPATAFTYEWTVPAVSTTQARVRVRQDGLGGQWDDVSDADSTIVPEPATVLLLAVAALGTLPGRGR